MAILGIESVVYGVGDMAEASRFLDEFGLIAEARDGACCVYRLAEGSRILLLRSDDPTLPSPSFPGEGPREVVWGVDTPRALAEIRSALKNYPLTVDEQGGLHTRDPNGVAIGFSLFDRRRIEVAPSGENSCDNVARWNRPRRWYPKAEPKVIHHLVFLTPDVDACVEFYVDLLGFRITDISRAFGVFVRADGRNDHHNIFFMQGSVLKFHHLSFGVDNIDELMVGANNMQRNGFKSFFGLGRHRVSSGIFFFMPSPFGGEFEYFADSDYADDYWEPRLWEPGFGAFQWAAELPGPVRIAPVWSEPRPLPKPIPKFSSLSQAEAKHVFLTQSGEAVAEAVAAKAAIAQKDRV